MANLKSLIRVHIKWAKIADETGKEDFFLSLKIFSNMNIPGNRLLTEKDAMLRSC